MTKQEYIDQVLFLINEAGMTERQTFQLTGADNSDVCKQIINIYPAAWKKCMSVLPRQWWQIQDFTDIPVDNGEGSGYVLIPDNWYCLHTFKMKGWKKAVFQAYEIGDPVAEWQTNLYSRGTPLHPVCVIATTLSNDNLIHILNYYSLPRHIEHNIEQALYLPYPPALSTLQQSDILDLHPNAQLPLTYLAAASVCRIFENWDAAQYLENESKQLIPNPRP